MRTLIITLFICLNLMTSSVFADTERPSVVPNVNATGSSNSSITVTWGRASDNVGVDGYNVYRNGDYYKTVSNTLSYTDNNVSAGNDYRYSIVAFDDARNYSSQSASATARTSGSSSESSDNSSSAPTASGRPAPPSGLRAQVRNSSSADLSWNAPSGGAEGYNIYRDGSYFTTVKGRRNYTATSLSSSRDYTFHVTAFRNDQHSSRSSSVNVRTSGSGSSSSDSSSSDNSSASAATQSTTSNGKPAAPTQLSAQAQGTSSVELTWAAPSGGAEGYNIYRDGNYSSTVKGSTRYTANSLSSNRNYAFSVVAFRNGQYSSQSASVSVRTGSSSGNDATSNDAASPPPQASNDSSNGGVPSGYELVFSDEFDRSSVDSSKWNTRYRWGPNWIINNEEQYYIDSLNDPNFGESPFRHGSGRLTIRAVRTPGNLRSKSREQNYLSGAMTTHGKFRMKYGYVEMRARLPRGKGLWPAFWLLHDTDNGNRPEIDVMENLGDNTRLVYQTYHHYDNGNLRSTPSYRAPGPDYASSFHTFGMLWEPGRISWYVDGNVTNVYENGNVASEDMYLLVNLALGGAWAGSPDGSTSFPAEFQIDYIRAYQQR